MKDVAWLGASLHPESVLYLTDAVLKKIGIYSTTSWVTLRGMIYCYELISAVLRDFLHCCAPFLCILDRIPATCLARAVTSLSKPAVGIQNLAKPSLK